MHTTLRRAVAYRIFCASLVLATAGLVVTAARAEAQDWKGTLVSALEESFPISKRATFAPDRVTKQGVVLMVKKEGIGADLSSDVTYSRTLVRQGEVGQAGGATAAIFTKSRSRVFNVGERVFVIDIKAGDRDVSVYILSVNVFEVNQRGSTKQVRYKAEIRFEFPDGYLATATPDEVRKSIESVVAPEGAVAAEGTKTIALGQTRAQVEEILGKPERIVDLGAKVIYVYKDMKVTFVDGKVSDVQ